MQLRGATVRVCEKVSAWLISQRGILVVPLMFSLFCQGCASVVDVSRHEGSTMTESMVRRGAQNEGLKLSPDVQLSKVSHAAPVQSGKASWYGPGFHGKLTASGETFDEAAMTAAHNSLPLGSKAKVTNLVNGQSVEVLINDRGPFVEGRIIDLSRAAARALGILEKGIAMVRVELIGASSVK